MPRRAQLMRGSWQEAELVYGLWTRLARYQNCTVLIPFSVVYVFRVCGPGACRPRHTVRLNPRGARQRVRRSDAIPHTPAIPRASGRKMIVPTAVSTRDLRHFGATPREGELERGSGERDARAAGRPSDGGRGRDILY